MASAPSGLSLGLTSWGVSWHEWTFPPPLSVSLALTCADFLRSFFLASHPHWRGKGVWPVFFFGQAAFAEWLYYARRNATRTAKSEGCNDDNADNDADNNDDENKRGRSKNRK